MIPNIPSFAAPLAQVQREMDRLFDRFMGGIDPSRGGRAFPLLNAWEDGDKLLVEAEIPGLKMDDLELLVQGNELTIRGHRPPIAGENVVYHRRERGTGEFSRFVTLPAEVDPDRVEATLADGVLTVVMPKSERARARRIVVKTD